MINTPYQQLNKHDKQLHPALQLFIFICVFGGVLLVGNLIGFGIVYALYGMNTVTALASLNLATPHIVQALWIFQIAGTTLPIFAAPIIFSYLIVHDPQEYIKPGLRFTWVLLVLVFVIMFLSNPLIELLSNINQKMVLPPWLKWMRDSEDSNEKLLNAMLQMNSVWDCIVDVILVGLLTAIVEEFMFRGVIQTIFTRWTKSAHAAIWITAILFSAFHMEFFGFLPRLALGVFFGYFVVWSGSIWTAVWAHFLNNGTAVVITYLFQHKLISINPDDQHLYSSLIYILSTMFILFLMILYRMIAFQRKNMEQY